MPDERRPAQVLPDSEPETRPEPPETPKKKPAAESGGWLQSLYEWLQVLVVVLVIIVGAFTFLVSIIGVDGSSMYPTLHDGDLMLVQRIAYSPGQGDVIVLRKDGAFENEALVKRIIATGGQTVTIDYDANTVTVDGQVLDEPYLNYEYDAVYGSDFLAQRGDLDPAWANTTFTVPEGSVFVCGDNRNHSSDSRSVYLGMVDERYIIGRVLLVFYPLGHISLIA